MRRFCLYRRGKVWYCKLYNPSTKRYLSGRSTGEIQRDAALLTVAEWLSGGVPEPKQKGVRPVSNVFEVNTVLSALRVMQLTKADAQKIVSILRDRQLIETAVVKAGPESQPLVSFLKQFWNYTSSPYVREKLAHEHRIGKRHCYGMTLCVNKYWVPYFAERRLSEIRKADLQAFAMWLKGEKGQKGKTVNNCLAAGTVALRWAAENEYIPASPGEGLMKFSGKSEKRGVLVEDEVCKLFAKPWLHERAYVGNLLAMSTGLRLGEVLAVQVRDIETDRLRVRHSWSEQDKLKGTKTGEERAVPLLPDVRAAMLELARKNPHGIAPTAFVFWSIDHPGRPMDAHPLPEELRTALVRMRLCEDDQKNPAKVEEAMEYWKTRKVVFHSWRHYYAARMADRLEAHKVMSATGHKNGAVFEAYAEHLSAETFDEVRTASVEAFGRLLPFAKPAEGE